MIGPRLRVGNRQRGASRGQTRRFAFVLQQGTLHRICLDSDGLESAERAVKSEAKSTFLRPINTDKFYRCFFLFLFYGTIKSNQVLFVKENTTLSNTYGISNRIMLKYICCFVRIYFNRSLGRYVPYLVSAVTPVSITEIEK